MEYFKKYLGFLMAFLGIAVFIICIVGIIINIGENELAHPVIIWILFACSIPLIPYGFAVYEKGEFKIRPYEYWKYAKYMLIGLGLIASFTLVCYIIIIVISLL
jgi:hypothetical protein